jgi:hypothetical protein
MPKFANTFHTLRTMLGIRDSERHLVLKYRGGLHRYIQTKMEFLNISLLGAAYRYVVKIEQKFKQRNKLESRVLRYISFLIAEAKRTSSQQRS